MSLPLVNGQLMVNVGSDLYEFKRACELDERRLYLYGEISPIEFEDTGLYYDASMTTKIVENIFEYNRQDKEDGIPIEERKPIKLFINSPGGDVTEGFSLIDAIELSKTPVYTYNLAKCCSMAFLVFICGHKRFSLPKSMFLMHDGSTVMFGSSNKVQDRIEFEKRFGERIIKEHVLKHSNMDPINYSALARVELYLLADEARKYGFVDEIVTDIDTIL